MARALDPTAASASALICRTLDEDTIVEIVAFLRFDEALPFFDTCKFFRGMKFHEAVWRKFFKDTWGGRDYLDPALKAPFASPPPPPLQTPPSAAAAAAAAGDASSSSSSSSSARDRSPARSPAGGTRTPPALVLPPVFKSDAFRAFIGVLRRVPLRS